MIETVDSSVGNGFKSPVIGSRKLEKLGIIVWRAGTDKLEPFIGVVKKTDGDEVSVWMRTEDFGIRTGVA